MTATTKPLPVKLFKSPGAWEAWLEKNHATSTGLWIKFAKKGTGIASITHAEALETALCYGWIDGQAGPSEEGHWLQRFTPRRPRSKWSQINRAAATALLAQGRMKATGKREVEAAKGDGRWESAYAPQRTIEVPDDLRERLAAHPRAGKFFARLDSKNRYAILYRIHEAKRPETRRRRIEKFIAMLDAGKTIH